MRRAVLLLAAALAGAAAPAQDETVKLLESLTLEQRAGQLFQAWTLSRASAAEREKLIGWIRDAGLGGVILSLGTSEQARALIAELQSAAQIPLLISGDFETSVAFRLEGATEFGNSMLLGATQLPRLAEAAARATALEARVLGFHWAFAPVADVNVNPSNPIINVRSFGEDPQIVARFTAATVRGLEAGGLLSTLKHFPGHGDVATDSHLAMPTVPGDRARLEQVELVPFRAGVAAGASSIMTGHLAVPGLGESSDVPATLSPKILGLLRGELGFRGLIVTDALDMGGVAKKVPPPEAAVRALLAGADVLLMPPDPIAARDAVVAAVRSGRLPMARFDEAVLRVLRAKERVGLLDRAKTPPAAFDRSEHAILADEIAARGLTLVRDAGLVPLPQQPGLLVTLHDKEAAGADPFAMKLGSTRTLSLHPGSSAAELDRAAAALADAPLAVIAFDVRVRSYSGRIGLPEPFAPVLAAIARHPRVVAISFGNPYLLGDCATVPSYVCAYARTPQTMAAAAAVLRGEAPVTGRLPVTIPGQARRGSGTSRFWERELRAVSPRAEGMRATLAADLRALLERAVADRVTPGAVALVSRRGRIVAEVPAGRLDYGEQSAPVTSETLYDLASLTKVCATTPLILRLVAEGTLELDQRVQELLPQFQGSGKERIEIRHLLAHCSGLPDYRRFFRDEAIRGHDAMLAAAMREPLVSEAGQEATYSDLGMMLLMACAERATGRPFADLVREQVLTPLGMRSARFAPGGSPVPAAPTEDDPWRGRVVQGEVHDENAAAMGGVSGHAGLFGTARDVARIGHAFLGGGAGGWLPAALVETACSPAGIVAGSSRALGWDTFVPGGSGGSKLSPDAFGHTGFTGTSIWCDPASDLCIVLLTNRVHPTRENNGIAALRRELADLVAGAIE